MVQKITNLLAIYVQTSQLSALNTARSLIEWKSGQNVPLPKKNMYHTVLQCQCQLEKNVEGILQHPL